MREYYTRFFKEFGRQVFAFWQSQVYVSLGAGIIAAIASSVRQESPFTIALWSVGIAAIGYIAMLGIFSICAIMATPVRLDRERVEEIRRQKEDSERIIAYHREDAREQHLGRIQAEAALREEKTRKHPHDEHLDRATYEAVAKLNGQEIGFLQWLLDHERAGNSPIQMTGFHGIPTSVIEKTGHFLLTFDSYRPGNGIIEWDRFYYINPKILAPLRNIFYPSRPVTPPPA